MSDMHVLSFIPSFVDSLDSFTAASSFYPGLASDGRRLDSDTYTTYTTRYYALVYENPID